MPEHRPVRPIWLCRACGQPWPCGEARLRLAVEYREDRVGLSVYMASMMGEAISELRRLNPQPEPDGSIIFARFVGWTRQSNT